MMKPSHFLKATAIPLFWLAGASASAQSSVTLYGIVDDALVYANNQQGHSNFYTRSGNVSASRFGLRGSEPLGGTTSAIFDLQEGFDIDSGKESSSGLIFNRQAFVGLQDTRAGTLTLGRQYSAYYQILGGIGPVGYLTGATGAHPGDLDALDTTVRLNNSVQYVTPLLSGFSAAVQYAFGEMPGTLQRGSSFSSGIKYANGPFTIGAAYLRLYNTGNVRALDPNASGSYGSSSVTTGFVSAHDVQHVGAAATYKLGLALLGLNYTNVRFKPGNSSLFTDTAVFNTYGAIAHFDIAPQFDAAVGYSYTRASASNGISDSARYHQVSLKESYHFSKRTALYALQAYQHASGQTLGAAGGAQIVNATATVGDSQNSTPASGSNQFVGMFGIVHNF
ncbi:porin [Cupriavidus basilensis]|uniref:porin n=1 Tax=Cupriavidus basilensis TaxID=68895 RepID=UPI0039F6995A